MSVQEPQDQFGRETVEDEIQEPQDFVNDSASTDPGASAEAVDVSPEEDTLSSEESTDVEDADDLDVPAIESMPVSSSSRMGETSSASFHRPTG